MLSNLRTSNPSLLARRWRRLTSIVEESTPWFVIPCPCKNRCSQTPSRPASSQLTTGGCVRQTQAAFGVGDLFTHAFLRPCGHGALARLLPLARGEAELPSVSPQFKGYKQGTRCRALLHMAKR